MDKFEDIHRNNKQPECDEELSYLVKCLEDDILFKWFFHEIYSSESPLAYETQVNS